MGGKGSGGARPGSFKNPLINMQPNDNARILSNALVGWERKRVDTKNPEAVENSIREYFQHCMECDMKPGVMGMSNWLGIHCDTLKDWLEGKYNKPMQPIIIKAYTVLQNCWEQYMNEGKINPVVGIFQGKAYYGLKDTQEIVVNTANDTQRLSASELVAESKMLPGSERFALTEGEQTIE